MSLAFTLVLLWPLAVSAPLPAQPPEVAPDSPAAVSAVPAVAPATQPAAATPRTVVVFPLLPPKNDARFASIARTIQEDLISSLTAIQGTQALVLRGDTTAPPDDEAAIAAARKLGASLVVYGNYQLMDPNVRVVVKVADTATNRIIGSVRATGVIKDLFNLEDVLGQQVQQLVLSPDGPPPGAPPDPALAPTTQPADAAALAKGGAATQPAASTPNTTPQPIASGPLMYAPPYTPYNDYPDNGPAFQTYNSLNSGWDPWSGAWWGTYNTWGWGPWCWGGWSFGPSPFFFGSPSLVLIDHHDHHDHHDHAHGTISGPGTVGHLALGQLGSNIRTFGPTQLGHGPVQANFSAVGATTINRGGASATVVRNTFVTPSRAALPGNGSVGNATTITPEPRGTSMPQGRSTFPGFSGVRAYSFVSARTASGSFISVSAPSSPANAMVGGRFFMVPRSAEPAGASAAPAEFFPHAAWSRSSGYTGYGGYAHTFTSPQATPSFRGGFSSGFSGVSSGGFHSFSGPSFGGMEGGAGMMMGGGPAMSGGGARGGGHR